MAFVGRERELARLASALEAAAEGRIRRVCLLGPAGIGVSRLLIELEKRLVDVPDVIVARGTAYEPAQGVPYFPLATALRGALSALPDERLLEVVAEAGWDLASLVPALRERLERLDAFPKEPLLAAPDQRGARLSEAVIGAVERLAGDGVVLLAIEDLQWADPGTRAFVDALLRISRRLPLCLVVNYRPDELHRRHPMRDLAERLATHPGVEQIPLQPLDRNELVSLLESLMGERPSGSFVAAAIEGSQGYPLVAEQLVAARASVEGLRLSDPFELVVQARLGQLTVAAARCLRALAAARRPIGRELLLRLELPEGRLTKTGLSEALGSGLAVALDGEVAIVHERFAEAIEGLGLPAERQQVHAVLARAVDEPAEEAWHWGAAMRFAPARNAHAAAGRAAEATEPGGTALLHYERALELLEASDAEVPMLETPAWRLLAHAAQAAFVAGQFRRAVGLVQQAISERSAHSAIGEASKGGHEGRRRLQLDVGLLQERLGRYRWASGDLASAISAFERGVHLVPDEPMPERARVLGALAQHLMLDGRFQESARLAERAAATARAAGPDALADLGHATCTLGVDVAYGGDLDRGLALLEEATAIARQAGRLDELMRTYANRTTLLDLDSRREAALAVVQEGIREARRWGLEAVYGAFLRGNAADCLFNLGRWAESEAECRAALEWSPSGVAWFSPLLYLGLVTVESRADEEASRIVGQILLQLEAVPEGQWTAIVQRTATSFALWRDDLADAQRVARRGWERVLQTDDWAQIAMAASTTLEVCAAVAEASRSKRDWASVASSGELAQRVLEEAERRVGASGMPRTLGARREAELHLGVARAHAHRVRGKPDSTAWARLAEAWAAIPVPYQAAKARWWQASAALQAREERAIARDALLEAWRIAAELPARPLQRELAGLAHRARVSLPGQIPEARPQGPPAVVAIPSVLATPGRVAAEAPSATFVFDPTLAGVATDGETLRADGFGTPSAPTPTSRAISERLTPSGEAGAADPFGLSPRESEVLLVLAEGRTNREIAERLFISERTVGVHVRRILAKLGVSGRVEAASVAIRLGLVPGFERGVHSGGPRG
ncbi:MAG TPA: AAA family ATPase [Candidatus Limnocylindrales bacterium]|nr:AAA family ATPase [Candidatus Limnocylindrales bacterium]